MGRKLFACFEETDPCWKRNYTYHVKRNLQDSFRSLNSPSAVKTTLARFAAFPFGGSGVLGLLFEGNDVLAPPFGGSDVLVQLFAGSDSLGPLFAGSDSLGPLFAGSDVMGPSFSRSDELGPSFEEGDSLGRFFGRSEVITAVRPSFGLSDAAPITSSSAIFATSLTMV